LTLNAPFPWFGGKSRVAHLVWDRFGSVPNYVEPFAGSLAVLLARPTPPGTETVNDADCFLANFWRAIRAHPEAVAMEADSPCNEADLHARHLWLVEHMPKLRERITSDPDYFDPQVAGWWVWGISLWIGDGWCTQPGWQGRAKPASDSGIHAPRLRGDGRPPVQLPHPGSAGMGVHKKLPHLGDAGMGVHKKLPHLGDAGRGHRLFPYFSDLAERLRRVRVACGDWSRIMGESVTVKHGATGVLLDPPYVSDCHAIRYVNGREDLAAEVLKWATENGDNPLLRIALCGYDGMFDVPDSWECVAWKASGGYGSQAPDGRGRSNSKRERIWFSPHCLKRRLIA
jgi:hypothetical protein